MNPRHALVLSALALAITSLTASAAFGACEADSPARAVPQFDPALAPGVSLWPLDLQTDEILLQPAGLTPGTLRAQVPQLPANRDSTQYIHLSIPGEQSGHELFQDVAIPGRKNQSAGMADWAVVVYNAGLEVWDLRADPEMPTLKDEKDLFKGEWASGTPGVGEGEFFVWAVDVIQEGNILYIGVAAKQGVGFSVWTYNITSNSLVQKYQDRYNVEANDVSMVTDTNGRKYAFVSDLGTQGNSGGVKVYDISSAGDLGSVCVDPNGSYSCGIYEGKVGSIPRAYFVDALVTAGETYVAASDGNLSGGLAFQLWQVSNPETPESPPTGASIQRFSGLGTNVSSPQLFSYDGDTYLALVEKVGGANPEQMRIHDIDHCLSSSCGSLNAAKATETIKNSLADYNFLDVSFSNGAPFLHYGMETTGLFGSGFERLWDLGPLPSTSATNTLPEITDTGGTYLDPCDNAEVDYFGDYYVNNEWGLRNFKPRHAMFTGKYLYRAGYGVFDIHMRGGSVQTSDPVIIPDLQAGGSISTDTFWLDESVALETLVQNCTPGPLDWCWNTSANNPDVDAFPIPIGLDGCDPSFDATHTLTFLCTGPGRCADSAVTVEAWNESATCAATGINPGDVSFNLKDPEVDATSLDTGGTSFPECQVLSLSATAEGRGAVEWAWLADGLEIEGCVATIPTGTDLSTQTFSCDWDSSGQTFDLIFGDGFENGTCNLWDEGCPATFKSGFITPRVWSSAVRRGGIPVKAGGSMTVEFEVRTTLGVVLDSLSQLVTFNPVGDPAFAGPLPAPVVNGSGATLQAPATDTTTWTWEVEDPAVSGAPCSFNASKNCVMQDTSVDTIDYLWQGAGTYIYKVSLSNCSSVATESLTGSATVQDANQPEITSFKVALSSIQTVAHPERPCTKDVLGNCGSAGTIYCPTGVSINFDLAVLEEGSFSFSFDWDRASAGETPTYANQAPASVTGTAYVFTRTFPISTSSPNFPISAVQFGNEVPLSDSLKFGSCP